MHRRMAAIAMLALASSLRGQTITITPLGGATIPTSGNLRVFAPSPPFGDTLPYTFSNKQGISLGALVEFDSRGAFGAAALVTLNQTTRSVELRGIDGPCRDCDSRTIGLALLGTAKLNLTRNVRIHLGLGPELLTYSGGAVSTEPFFLPPNHIRIAPRGVIGAVGSLGVSYGVRGAVLRAQAAFRYSAPRYEKEDKDFPVDPVFTSKPLQDVVISVGVGFQPWSRTRETP
jgi:hypothetical protein